MSYTSQITHNAPRVLILPLDLGERARQRWKLQNASGYRRMGRSMQFMGWTTTFCGIRSRVWTGGGKTRLGRGWSSGNFLMLSDWSFDGRVRRASIGSSVLHINLIVYLCFLDNHCRESLKKVRLCAALLILNQRALSFD